MGRKRIYDSDSARQRAFQQRKRRQQLIEQSKAQSTSPVTLSKLETLTRIYPEYTFEQMKEAYAVYRELYLEARYDVALRGDVDYIGKHSMPHLETEEVIILAHGITLSEMEGNMNNTVFNECPKHGIRYSIFLDLCPKCSKERVA